MTQAYRITDVHIHIQPWRDMLPHVQESMRRGKEDHWDFLLAIMDDPKALLDVMDRSGVWRVGMVNYTSPDVMGFTDTTNTFIAKYALTNPERLMPYGGVHARFTTDPEGDVDRLVDLGIRCLKIHPPHQLYRPTRTPTASTRWAGFTAAVRRAGCRSWCIPGRAFSRAPAPSTATPWSWTTSPSISPIWR